MISNFRDAKRPRPQSDATILASFSNLKGWNSTAFLEELARKVSTLPAHPEADTGWWCAHQPLMKELLPYLADGVDEDQASFWEGFRTLVGHQISSCRLCCIQYHKTILDYELDDFDDRKLVADRVRAFLNWDVERLLPKLRRLAQEVCASRPGIDRDRFFEKYALLEALHNFRICNRREISEIIGEILSKATPLDMKDIVPVVKKLEVIPSGLLALCFHPKPVVNSWAQRLCTQLSKIRHPHRDSAYAVLQKVCKQLERSSFGDNAKGVSTAYAIDKRTAWQGFGTIFVFLDGDAVVDLCARFGSNKLFKVCLSAITESDEEIVIRSATCLLRIFEFVSCDRLFTSELTPQLLLQRICTSFKQGRRRVAQRRLLDLLAPTISGARKIYDRNGASRLFHKAFDFLYKETHFVQQNGSEYIAHASIGSTDRPSTDRSAILKCGARLLEAFYSHSAPSPPIRNPHMISNFVLTVLREEADSDCSWDLLRVVLVTDAFNLIRALCSSGEAREVATIYPLRRTESLMSTGQEAKLVESFKDMQIKEEREDFWVLPLWKSLRAGMHSPSSTERQGHVCENEVRLLLDLHMVIGMVDCTRLEDAADRKTNTGPLTDVKLAKEISRADSGRSSARERLCVMQSTISDRFFLACQNSGSQDWWSALPFHATHLLASARKEVSHKGFAALRKSKNILGASCFGSQSKLLATVVKDDSVSAKMMADGCYAAMRIIDALGHRSSIRAFPSVMLWYRVLLESTYNDLFNSGDQTCAVGVIVVFFTNWRRFEQSTENLVFREVCCRLFTNLRDVWGRLMFESNGDDKSYMNADGRRDGLRKALNGIISMHRLRDNATRGAWVNLICSIGESWRNTHCLREQMVIAVQYHESSREMLSFDQCQRITEAGNLIELKVTMHRWSKDQELRMAQKESKPRKLETTTIDQFFGSAPQADRMVRAVVERKNSSTPFIGKGFASRETRFLRPPSNVRSLKMPGQSSALLELRKDMKATQKGKLTRDVRSTRRAPVARGGKTAFELLVAKNQAMKKTRMVAENRQGAIVIDESMSTGSNMRPPALPTSMKQSQGRFVASDSEHDEIEAAKERFSLPSFRRHLHPREWEQVYRNILGSIQKLSSLPRPDSVNSSRHSYVDIEEYVSYWEPFVISEFQSSVQKAVAEEEILWDREGVKASFSPWRAPFTVEGAMESIGYVQHISVRYCEDELPFNGKRKSTFSDYEVSKLQVSDLVLLFIPPPKFAKKTPGVNDTFTALGLVMTVVRKPKEFSLTLKVAFDRLDKAPGNGRQIQVIRLLSTTTLQRQLHALWRLPKICSGVLRPILAPREGVDINKAVCLEQVRLFSNAVATRSRFLDEMHDRGDLNDSQKDTIAEVLKSCSPLFRAQENGAVRCDHVSDHGSFTMIQGPPGTGKTSTIIALMSTLLLPGAQNQAYKNVRIGFDDTFAVMRVPKVRILVCAPSNAAVDELMLRVMEDGLSTPGGFKATPMMVRVGGGTTNVALKAFEVWEIVERRMARNGPSQSDDAKPLAQIRNLQQELSKINSKIGEASKKRQDCDLHQDLEIRKDPKSCGSGGETYSELTEQLTALHNRKRAINNKLSETRSAVRDTNAAHKTEQTRIAASIVNSCSVVFSTLSSSGHDLMRTAGARFDIIIVDEAAQCCEPELVIPVACSNSAKNQNIPASHLVLVGDPKQLPATVISADRTVQRALGSSLFERVASNSGSSVHMLRTQYRMHPAISAFPSTHFYDGRLLNGENVCSKETHQSFHLDEQLRFGPLSFIDTSRTNSKEVRSAGGSLCNSGEAMIIISAVTSLIKIYQNQNFKDRIVILSPYKQQVTLLKRLLSENQALKGIAVEVSTIDGIQGREKSIVFLSTVRSGHGNGIGFVDDDRRVNVAITRAKHSLIIFGHSVALSQGSRLWDSLIAHCRLRSLVRTLPVEGKKLFPESTPNGTVQAAPRLPPLPELAIPDDSGRIMSLGPVRCGSLQSKPAPLRGISLRSQPPSPAPVAALQVRDDISLRNRALEREPAPTEAVCPRFTEPPVISKGRNETHEGSAIDSSGGEIGDRDQVVRHNRSKQGRTPGEKPLVNASSRQVPAEGHVNMTSAFTGSGPNMSQGKLLSTTETRDGSRTLPYLEQHLPAKERLLSKNAVKTADYLAHQSSKAGVASTADKQKAPRGDDEKFSTSRALYEKGEGRHRDHELSSGQYSAQIQRRDERNFCQVQEEGPSRKLDYRHDGRYEQGQGRRSILQRLGNRSSQRNPKTSRKAEPSPDRGFELIRDGEQLTSSLEYKLEHSRSREGRHSEHRLEERGSISRKGVAPQSSGHFKRDPRVSQSQEPNKCREIVGSLRTAIPPSGQGGHLRVPPRRQRVRTEKPLGHNAAREAPQLESTLRSRSSNLNRRPDRAAIEARLIADSRGQKRHRGNHETESKQKKQRVAAQPSGRVNVQTQRHQQSNRNALPPLARMTEQMRQTNRMRRFN